jgi:hypothetical protein
MRASVVGLVVVVHVEQLELDGVADGLGVGALARLEHA